LLEKEAGICERNEEKRGSTKSLLFGNYGEGVTCNQGRSNVAREESRPRRRSCTDQYGDALE